MRCRCRCPGAVCTERAGSVRTARLLLARQIQHSASARSGRPMASRSLRVRARSRRLRARALRRPRRRRRRRWGRTSRVGSRPNSQCVRSLRVMLCATSKHTGRCCALRCARRALRRTRRAPRRCAPPQRRSGGGARSSFRWRLSKRTTVTGFLRDRSAQQCGPPRRRLAPVAAAVAAAATRACTMTLQRGCSAHTAAGRQGAGKASRAAAALVLGGYTRLHRPRSHESSVGRRARALRCLSAGAGARARAAVRAAARAAAAAATTTRLRPSLQPVAASPPRARARAAAPVRHPRRRSTHTSQRRAASEIQVR